MKAALQGLLAAVLLTGLPLARAQVSAAPAPSQAALPSSAYPFSKDALSAELTRALVANYAAEGDLQAEVLSNLPRTLPGADTWAAEVLEFPGTLSSLLQLRVRVSVPGRDAVDFPVNVRVQLWREVLVAREPIEREEPLSPSLLDLRRVDVLRERNAVPVSAVEGQMVFRTAVPAGRLIQWRDIERRALVRKGDLIEVVASDGQLVVKMKGMALQNGAAGETILVRNMQSKRDIAALVVAENQARVRF